MSDDDREDSSLFGRLSWPETPQEAESKERANLAKERSRAAARAGGAPVGLLTARRVVAVVWLTVVAVQVLIWGVISIVGGEFAFPWWVWTLGGGGLLVGGFWLAAGAAAGKRGPSA